MNEELGKFIRLTRAPSRLARLELETFDRAENSAAVERVEELGADLAGGGARDASLVLTGPFGVGKTRLAVWLLRRAFEFLRGRAGSSVGFPRFFRSTDLAELRFGRSFSGPEDEEDRKTESRDALERSPFVVIDDISRLAGYRGEELYLETVVEKRFDAELGTVLTANKLPGEGRFADFIRYFEEIPLVGRSHRG
jgi:DNA replication protein DnaC